jgi:SAM-dependent methyltransferase
MTESHTVTTPVGSPNPQPIYVRRFAGHELLRARVWETLNRCFFGRWIRREDAVLDLGAGYCEFINCVQARERFALDLNPDTPGHAGDGVRVLRQDATQPWDIPSDSLDVVFTSNFLEHLGSKQDVVHCLEEGVRALRPGGYFIAMGPNIRIAYDIYWDYFDHNVPLSDRSMAEAVELSGLKVETVIPRFLPYTMVGKTALYPAFVRLYLSMPWAWRLIGKQFLIVARK